MGKRISVHPTRTSRPLRFLLDHRHRLMPSLTSFHTGSPGTTLVPLGPVLPTRLVDAHSFVITSGHKSELRCTPDSFPCPHTAVPKVPRAECLPPRAVGKLCVAPTRLISTLIHSSYAQPASRYSSSSSTGWCIVSNFPFS